MAKKDKIRRAIAIKGTDTVLEVSKAAALHVEKEFIHFDKLADGTWRILYTSKTIPDFSKISAFEVIREG